MLQRNALAYPLVLPTLDPPVEVPPGGELNHPVLLAGFEPVPDEQPDPKTTKTARKATPQAAPDNEE